MFENATAIPTAPPPTANSSKSVKKKARRRTLHWEPIEEDVAGSVWAKAAALEQKAPTIPKVEYLEELHKLFGKKKGNQKGKKRVRRRKRKQLKKRKPASAPQANGKTTFLSSSRAQVHYG